MILNEKNDFTFWIRYGISTNFGMIVLDYPKSEVTQRIPAGYCHAHMLLHASAVNYNVNGKYTKYFAQLYAAEFLRFGIFPPQITDSCGATYRRKCVFSVLQRIYRPLANDENRVQFHS